ncbi:MAG: NAD(P)/FAD-dependent oxidoreductase [Lachnospiraceae bacterium]
MSSVIVVGGGAAGMMAAVAAGRRGHRVTLLEKNEKLGKKIYITGKGRCNFTNACDVEQLFGAVVSNPKFLYSAIYGFDNSMTMEFFREMGMPWKVERGNRVFPVSDHSSDVTKALERAMDQAGVKVLLQTEVKDIRTHGEQVAGVEVKRRGPGGERHREHTEVLPADAVIVATGGISYPTTGSTGDGYGWAKRLGHGLVDTRPALVPMVALEDYIPAMQGLSLRNVTLRIRDQRGRELYREFGEMLFTHFGVSGPLVLTASSLVGKKLAAEGTLAASIDLKPALEEKQLQERLLREFSKAPNRHFGNVLREVLPAKMVPVAAELSHIPEHQPVREITREQRNDLVKLLKGFPFTLCGLRGFSEAIITQGGVSVRDVDPSTMESRKVGGLYFAGEVLDLDALTGGFNLQIAWSTGFLAGSSVP